MGDEPDRLIGPQELVETAGRSGVRRVDHDLQLLPNRLGDELASDLKLGFGVGVEVDARHPLARLMRKVVSRGTGRPVAPFSLPDFQAVPAMSRWAQSYLRVNFERKHAAVTLPAARPPIFAKSAKL